MAADCVPGGAAWLQCRGRASIRLQVLRAQKQFHGNVHMGGISNPTAEREEKEKLEATF